jgi:hypothetical protein
MESGRIKGLDPGSDGIDDLSRRIAAEGTLVTVKLSGRRLALLQQKVRLRIVHRLAGRDISSLTRMRRT